MMFPSIQAETGALSGSAATHIFSVRHGQTDWNLAQRIQGSHDIPLNATGRDQALRAALLLQAMAPFAQVFCSDLSRALETAQIIAQTLGLPLNVDSMWRERHYGALEGLTASEFSQQFPTFYDAWQRRDVHERFVAATERSLSFANNEGHTVQGESLIMLQSRIETSFENLLKQHAGQRLVLVSHGGVMDILLRWATGMTLQEKRKIEIQNGSVFHFVWQSRQLTLVSDYEIDQKVATA